MGDVTVIEDTLARIASYGVKATIVHTHDGIPIRSTLQDTSEPMLAPKLANLSARLFSTASATARSATGVRAGPNNNKENEGEAAVKSRPKHAPTVDSIRIRTSSGGTATEVIIMNGPANILVKDAQGGIANISTYDVMQCNGVIHVIDRVLLP